MKIMIKRFKILNITLTIIAITCTIVFSGCKKWLDIAPIDKVPQTVLFSSQQGMKDALTGVYLNLDRSSTSGLSNGLYTNDMTIGILSILSYSFDNGSTAGLGSIYNDAASYGYQNLSLKPEIAAMWKTFYYNIANLNNILSQIDAKKDIFTDDNYYRVKGEALALRAFMHLDIIRLWGQAPLTGGDSLAIPYVTKYGITNTPRSTVNQALDLCISDLREAKKLLAQTDISQLYSANTDVFKAYTQNHCNYWAVQALMARAFLYRGNVDSAAYYANTLINTGKFPLITTNVAAAANTMRDRLFSQELIFSLYAQNLKTINNTAFNSSKSLLLSAAGLKRVYETPVADKVDWRRTSWFDLNTSSATVLSKFFQDANLKYDWQNIMPLIRVSEMYYIASETANTKGDVSGGIGYINKVRAARGLGAVNTTITSDSLSRLIRGEYQKEFIGEGQLFFYYKRLTPNQAPTGYPLSIPANAYVFPLPDDQLEYGSK